MNKNRVNKLVSKYGTRTARIVDSYMSGFTTQQIAAILHVRRSIVTTTVSNLNRGAYSSVLD